MADILSKSDCLQQSGELVKTFTFGNSFSGSPYKKPDSSGRFDNQVACNCQDVSILLKFVRKLISSIESISPVRLNFRAFMTLRENIDTIDE